MSSRLRSRYSSIPPSTEANRDGYPYADVMRFPIDRFLFIDSPRDHHLKENELLRVDVLMYREYGVPYYDDLVLWLNNVAVIHDLSPGDTLQLPSKRDLDRYINKHMRPQEERR